ncbi:MAG: RnfABCDGE type electron transport complex subunit B [Mollicutes bacterium]|nr:RnfABCDGE type electron transport complex subunit B [Mollicutes bacterium]MDD7264442.1 RnfABCDGE type electron transport complex subunit B [bacterium]MDY4979386.1 RnfABCDGE type electron transport complex subunit B [Candidatus Onthovivens sp.]
MYILYALLILAGLSLLLGILVTIFSKILYVKEDTRIEEVTKMLPGYNCGACGYPGCNGMAEALVNKKEATPDKCKPSKKENKEKIINYLKENSQGDK